MATLTAAANVLRNMDFLWLLESIVWLQGRGRGGLGVWILPHAPRTIRGSHKTDEKLLSIRPFPEYTHSITTKLLTAVKMHQICIFQRHILNLSGSKAPIPHTGERRWARPYSHNPDKTPGLAPCLVGYNVKNVRISTDILSRIFHI